MRNKTKTMLIDELFENKESLNIVAEKTPFGIFRINTERKIVYSNENFKELLGLELDDKDLKICESLKEEDREDFLKIIDSLYKTQQDEIEFEIDLEKNDKIINTNWYLKKIMNGHFKGYLGIVKNITTKKEVLATIHLLRGNKID